MKHDINRWIFEIPLEDIRNEDYNERGSENPCVCCGKHIKNKKYFVHMIEPAILVSTEEPFDNDMGFFPIGVSCKNKLPNNFYFKD